MEDNSIKAKEELSMIESNAEEVEVKETLTENAFDKTSCEEDVEKTLDSENAEEVEETLDSEDFNFTFAYSNHVLTKEEEIATKELEEKSVDLSAINQREIVENVKKLKDNSLCLIFSLIALILSVVDSFFGIPLSIVGIVLSIVKLASGKSQKAIWALLIGIIALVLSGVMLIL